MYSSDILKPTTQIFVQQPHNIIESYHETEIEPSIYKKPIAYVTPIEQPQRKDKSIQTDCLRSDLIDIRDFERSQRMIGKMENRNFLNDIDINEISLLRGRVGILQNALDEQRLRNEEVKKLLMVSLGSDLASHFTQLMSDFTNTETRISSLLTEKKIINESADQLSIEADLWRNKYFAGRILVNELADWKQQFALRYQESLDAIHSLLQERQSIRVYLSLINDQVANICHNLSLDQPPSAPFYSNNTIDFVKHNLDSVKRVAQLLSAGSRCHDAATNSHPHSKRLSEYTDGEESALQVLSNRPNVVTDKSGRYITSFAAKDHQHMEQMALNVCRNCRGDIFVV